MKNWHNWATMVENWKFQDAVMLYIYIYIYNIYYIYYISVEKFLLIRTTNRSYGQNWKSEEFNDYWITEGFDYLEVCVHCYY